MVNLNRLHCFYICAQTKQITRAANILGVSQPSLSQQIKNFEEELGFNLFVRSAKAFELTPKGKTLFEKSVELFSSAEIVSDFVVGRKPSEYPLFTIGVSDVIERPFIAEIVGNFLKTKKSLSKRFQIISKSEEMIFTDFNKGKVDILLTESKLPKIKAEKIFKLPVFLVTSKKEKELIHVRRENIKTILNILQENFVLPSCDLPLRKEIDSFLKKNHISIPIGFESNVLSCTTRAIREGIGCGFVPLPYIFSDFKRNLVSVIGPTHGYWQQELFLYKSKQTDKNIVEHLSQLITAYL